MAGIPWMKIFLMWMVYTGVKFLLTAAKPLLDVVSFIIGITPNAAGIASLVAILFFFGIFSWVGKGKDLAKANVLVKKIHEQGAFRLWAIVFAAIVVGKMTNFSLPNPVAWGLGLLKVVPIPVSEGANVIETWATTGLGNFVKNAFAWIVGVIFPTHTPLFVFKRDAYIFIQVGISAICFYLDNKIHKLRKKFGKEFNFMDWLSGVHRDKPNKFFSFMQWITRRTGKDEAEVKDARGILEEYHKSSTYTKQLGKYFLHYIEIKKREERGEGGELEEKGITSVSIMEHIIERMGEIGRTDVLKKRLKDKYGEEVELEHGVERLFLEMDEGITKEVKKKGKWRK